MDSWREKRQLERWRGKEKMRDGEIEREQEKREIEGEGGR